ncbi:PREDICTED: proline-rich receptor-like protein kinase PERK10 [Tarenaya hassleriana]|uniref:proline-rich receptor-like protein kinase PERK10 n=1 Tax=Tarenaya hassleriana TaxID=28532 RepID=UPI00053C5AA8|nr:PREDICTED: proline-rich receptor-like protein kinase PERK10 [Tarenaya hassleriana]
MAIADDSFKRPGAVPFSWEIRPGVPKTQTSQPDNLNPPKKLSPLRLKPLSQPLHPPPPQIQPPSSSFIANRRPLSPLAPPSFSTPSPSPSSRLKPPPASVFYSPGPRAMSFRSSPRALSERWLLQRPRVIRSGPVPGSDYVVAGPGCFPTPLFRLKKSRISGRKKTVPRMEPEYGSDMETASPWSMSSRRSISPMWDSPKSSFSSNRFSPRFPGEAEWVGIGLF